jgi:uncharacterized membrane protein
MSYYKKLKKDLDAAAAAGVISAEQAGRVWDLSRSSGTFANFRAAHWIAAAAGLFVALGVILVVASNWDKIGPMAKIGAFLMLFYAAGDATLRLEEKPSAAIPLETLWFFMPVIGIGLYAQIFQLSGDPVKPYLAWAALSAPLAVFSKRPLAGYLCAILLTIVLYTGTLNSGNMLSLVSLSRYAKEGQPLWHWPLALGVLGGAAALYPGQRLGMPLGAAVVWLFCMLLGSADIAVGSTALLVLAGMSLAVLWLTYGSAPEDDKAGLALKVWLAAVYVATFFWHYRAGSLDSAWRHDTTPGAVITWLLFAGAFISVLFRPQRLLPGGKEEDYTAKALLAVSLLCAFLLFDTTESSAKLLAVIANLILAVFGVANILGGARNSSEKQINLGVAVITLTAVTRFVDIFGSMLKSGVAFIITGLAFGALAWAVNKGRKALIESVKK